MALDLPTPGADAGTWGSQLNYVLDGDGPGTLKATYGRRRMYDVRDYLGADDFGAAVNRAITAAAADTHGYGKPGQVVMPPGGQPLTTEIVPMHGVDLFGGDRSSTVLIPQGTIAGIKRISASGGDDLADVTFAGFSIDGSQQAGTYATSIKGLYLIGMKRCTFEDLYVYDTAATGVGNDRHRDCTYRNVIAERCGRLNDGTQGGGAGIGIGTGGFMVEHATFDGCVTKDNKRDGIFFETQSGAFPVGYKVIGHTSERNGQHGIADAGCLGLVVIGGTSRKNGKAGFAAYAGTIAPGAPGLNGLVSGLDLAENVEEGILLDYTVRQAGASFTATETDGTAGSFTVREDGYTFRNVQSRNNGKSGLRLLTNNYAVRGVHVEDSDLMFNDEAGIYLECTGTGSVADAHLQGNRIRGNGRDTAAGARQGIRINANLTRPQIVGNHCWDPAASGKTQTYGFQISNGFTITDGFLDGNDLRANLTGAANISGLLSAQSTVGANPGWTSGSGSPEGVVSAPIGTQYRRLDGGAATTLYVKETTAINTGWVGK